jgi:hypothetical protein
MEPPGEMEVAVHSDYTPITILLRLQNKIIEFTDSRAPMRSKSASEKPHVMTTLGLAVVSTESAILKK